jgi:hypothetical protein
MSHESIVPVKQDVNENFKIKIATYEIFDSLTGQITNHVTKKNGKSIAWAIDQETALKLHDMFARIHIFHEDNDDPAANAMLKEMRSKPQDNGFLHDSQGKLLILRMKAFQIR